MIPLSLPARPIRSLRRFMTVDPGPPRGPGDFRRIAVDVVWLARFFYLFVFFLMNTRLGIHGYLRRGDPTDPVWPTALLNDALGAGWAEAAYALPVIPVATAVLGILATVFPGCLIWRIGIFLYLFITVALINSYGSISHGGHFLVYISFALLFLPAAAGRPDRMSRGAAMRCIRAFWFAQFIPLFCYSLSGLWKVLFSGPELLTSDGFVRILLNRVMSDTSSMPLLLPYVVQYEHLSQFLLLGVVYLEVCAVFAWFRPHLHRPFGVMLILFHLGVGWLLNIHFTSHPVVLGIFMVFSPFSPRRSSWFMVAQSLPLLGIPFRIGARRRQPGLRARRAWLVYDGECPVCKRYALHLDVRNAVGELVLVDARDGGALVEEIENLPYDLNDGMVLKMDGRHYFGSEAFHMLALLSGRGRVFGAANRLLFGSRPAARMAYPLLVAGRQALLRLMGIPRIGVREDLDTVHPGSGTGTGGSMPDPGAEAARTSPPASGR